MRAVAFWLMVAEMIQGLIGAISNVVLDFLFELISFDFLSQTNYITRNFPFMTDAAHIVKVIGIALLIGITAFQLFRGTFAMVTETDRPVRLLVRSSIFLVVLYALPVLLNYVALKPLDVVWETLRDSGAGVSTSIGNVFEKMLPTIANKFTDQPLRHLAGDLLFCILSISLVWNLVKLMLLVVERWVQLYIIFVMGPLAAATGASASTEKIFSSYIRIVATSVLLIVMDTLVLLLFQSSINYQVNNIPDVQVSIGIVDQIISGSSPGTIENDLWVWALVSLGVLRAGLRLENIVGSSGISVAQVGAGLMADIASSFREIRSVKGPVMSAVGKTNDVIRGVRPAIMNAFTKGKEMMHDASGTNRRTEQFKQSMVAMEKQGIITPGLTLKEDVKKPAISSVLGEDIEKATLTSPDTGDIIVTSYGDKQTAIAMSKGSQVYEFTNDKGEVRYVTTTADPAIVNSAEAFNTQFPHNTFIAEGGTSFVQTGESGEIVVTDNTKDTQQTFYPASTFKNPDGSAETIRDKDGHLYYIGEPTANFGSFTGGYANSAEGAKAREFIKTQTGIEPDHYSYRVSQEGIETVEFTSKEDNKTYTMINNANLGGIADVTLSDVRNEKFNNVGNAPVTTFRGSVNAAQYGGAVRQIPLSAKVAKNNIVADAAVKAAKDKNAERGRIALGRNEGILGKKNA